MGPGRMNFIALVRDYQAVIAAVVAALMSFVVNGVFVWKLARLRLASDKEAEAERIRAAVALEAERRVSALELEAVRKAAALEIEAARSRHAREVSKYEDTLRERNRRRNERVVAVRRIRSVLSDVFPVFDKATKLTGQMSEEEVIEYAQTAFARYGDLRDLLRDVRGQIRRTHFQQLDELRGLLLRICLDMALEPAERRDAERLKRLESYRHELGKLRQRADTALDAAQIPESDEQGAIRGRSTAGGTFGGSVTPSSANDEVHA